MASGGGGIDGLLARRWLGQGEGQAHVVATDQEGIGIKLRHNQSAGEGVGQGVRISLDPGPVILAKGPAAIGGSEAPAAQRG